MADVVILHKLPNGWHKIAGGKVCFRNGASTEVYDESGLRLTLRGFLSDESFARFGSDKFCDLNSYYKHLKWFMDGMALLYCDA
jgi:hypothetical protein